MASQIGLDRVPRHEVPKLEFAGVQLDAGLVEGRLHLAAYALGLGASGMTFLDSELAGLLGEPPAGLLFTCVGVPTYRSKSGGRLGAPPRSYPGRG